MKIMLLSAARSIHTVKWANAIAERNHEVYMVCNRGHEAHTDDLNTDIKQIILKHSGTVGYYFNSRELSRVVKDIQPDVVNVHYASGYGTLARKAHIKTPLLLSVWGSDVYDFPYESRLKKSILKRNVNFATKLASTSYCMADQLRRVMDKQDLEITVTPFGVDLTLFEPNNYSQRKSSDEIVIGNIKALEPKYGIDKLLYAIEILSKKLSKDTNWNKKLVVKIYGSGSQKSYLEELAKKKGIGDIVKFEGRIPNMDVPKALSDFDIFCAMSQLESESFGVAVVEAMAMEVPVVVSDVDGFREVVKNKETGIIVNRDDVYAMAGALEELVRDEVKRISYGKAGRKRVQALYDWNKNVDLMEKVYNKLIKTR